MEEIQIIEAPQLKWKKQVKSIQINKHRRGEIHTQPLYKSKDIHRIKTSIDKEKQQQSTKHKFRSNAYWARESTQIFLQSQKMEIRRNLTREKSSKL